MVSFYCRYITSEIPGFVRIVKVVHKENSGRFIFGDEFGFMFCQVHVYLHISNYHWSCCSPFIGGPRVHQSALSIC